MLQMRLLYIGKTKFRWVQTGVLHHGHWFKKPVDPYVVSGDPASGLLPRISADPPGENGQADHRVQAYCFRMCLTDVPENRVPFSKPGGYDAGQYELMLRVLATGWRPYAASNLDNLGYGECPNVITNVMMERLAAPGGPTEGKILRPSDGEAPKNVAFVQCAGSRDENHLPYCSAVCCMASMKQARYIRESIEDAKVTIFYIDIRTLGRLEDFYYDLLGDDNVTFVKGKVAGISEDPGGNDLILEVEDTVAGEKPHPRFDMVVLATGIVPNVPDAGIPLELGYDEYGFLDGATDLDGVYAAGCATHPCDVSSTTKEATAAALHAIQCLKRG